MRQISKMVVSVVAIVAGLSLMTYQASADSLSTNQDAVRQMVSRSLPYIQRGGAEWREERQCMTCHRLSFTVWSLNRAAELGFKVDGSQLRDWNAWSTDWTSLLAIERREGAEMTKTLVAENDAAGQLLLGRPRQPSKGSDPPEWVSTYRDHLRQSQQNDGSWKSGGQLPSQKRPSRETQEVTTMWDLLALVDSSVQDPKTSEAISKGKAWLGATTRGKSTEWWATRLMLQRTTGEAERADEMRRELLELQNDDGGWGWICDEESDALATGIALYALARDGLARRSSSRPSDPVSSGYAR